MQQRKNTFYGIKRSNDTVMSNKAQRSVLLFNGRAVSVEASESGYV